MPDLKRCFQDVIKRWKNWSLFVALGFVGFVALLYIGTVLWQAVQDVNLNILIAFLFLCAVCWSIASIAWAYRMVVLVAVVGMVIGAVAGIFPYFVVVIILILLELSPEAQATSRQLSQLFNNDVFWELFFVAGAASGGPIAVLVYFKEEEKIDAEEDEDR